MSIPHQALLLALLACPALSPTTVAAEAHGRATKSAAGGWADVRVARPLVIRADFSLREVEPVCRELADLQRDLQVLLDIPPAQEWIEIYLLRDRATYERYLRRHLPELPTRRALYFKRDGPGMVFAYLDGQLATDLRHETTHALLHAVHAEVPPWLDEGLAEYFEMPREQRLQGHPYWPLVGERLRRGSHENARWGRLEDLEALGPSDMMNLDQYRAAWAWTHWMLNGPEAAGRQLRGYLADLRRHPAKDEASARPSGARSGRTVPLSRRLSLAVGNPREALRDHFRREASRLRPRTAPVAAR